jgi:parallel beta-helix repeat protein
LTRLRFYLSAIFGGTGNNSPTNNKVSHVIDHGFVLETSFNNALGGKTADGNNVGFFVYLASSDNLLSVNQVNSNDFVGFRLHPTTNTLSGNEACWNLDVDARQQPGKINTLCGSEFCTTDGI